MAAAKKTAGSPPSAETGWASTADEWQSAGLHNAELDSGARITFRDVSVGELIAADALPEDLLQIALLEYGDPGAGARLIAETVDLPADAGEEQREASLEKAKEIGRKLVRLNHELCAAAVVEPKLTAEQVARLPFRDLEMLGGFLTRRLIFDAAGRRVGVEPLDTFRVFAEEHGHDVADCASCQAARRRMATATRSR